MFFLLRLAFWLGIVLILLPTGSAPHRPATSTVGASDAISAASATVEDLRGFCARQPQACTVGERMATAIGYKAQAGAKMLYDVLTDALAPHESGSPARADGARQVTASSALDKPSSQASQDTLTANDLAPAWRGPHAVPPHRAAARRAGLRRDGRHPA